MLSLVLNQLDVIHFRALWRLTDVRSVSVGGRRRCWGLGAIFAKHLDAARDDQYWLNHVAVADEQIEREPAQLIGRPVKASVVRAVLPETVGNKDGKDGDHQRQDAEPSQGDSNEGDGDN